MPATKSKNTPTKYVNSKHHRIYLSAKGKPFTRSAAGKKSMGAKARFVSSNNGTVRKITPGNMKNIPNAMRPAVRQGDKKPKSVSKAAAKRVARPRLNNEARATRMFGAFLNKTRKPPKAKASARPSAARKVRSNVGVARKTNAEKASVAAARKRAAVFRRARARAAAGPTVRKVRKNKGVARKSNANKAATVAATRMMASAKRAAAKGTRKVRTNKGVSRNLVKSPGGTLYKGMAAFTRALKKL